jgi:hypothetical protein
VIVYISIGNSDDKLSQAEWSDFVQDVSDAIGDDSLARHGEWLSSPSSRWQNACWATQIHDAQVPSLKRELIRIAGEYRQDSIVWAPALEIEFLGASS